MSSTLDPGEEKSYTRLCNFQNIKKKRHVETCRFLLLLVYTLDITYQYWYRPDLLHFSFQWNEKLRFGSVEPSPATVHRTVAFDGSNLSVLDFSKIKSTPSGVLFILEVPARFELANNGFADRGLTTWLRYHMK